MKKHIAIVAALFALALPAAALAEGPSDWASEASKGGAEATEAAGAQCGDGAVSGSFGYFGEHGSGPRHDLRGGTDGYQTGLNNSAVCGNRPST